MQNNMSRNVYGNDQAAMSGQTLVPSIYSNNQAALSGQTMIAGQMCPQVPASNMHAENTNVRVDNLADAFGNMNLRNAAANGQGKPGNGSIPTHNGNLNAMMGPQANSPVLYQLPDGTFVYSGSNAAPGNYQQYSHGYNFAAPQPTQYQQAIYHNMSSQGAPNGPNTPRNHPWMPSHGIPQVPELVAPRRSSWSSTEEASPQTPADGYQPAVFISGISPTSWSTPSPLSAQSQCNQQFARLANGDYVLADFWEWTQQEPAIPPPVPAWRSGPDGGRGTLDKILDNRDGTTNVYVRGLRPDTTDELLKHYGLRFGPITSQKAIIEMSNGLCKGFGFIKYHNYIDAENCIRAFYYLGYEAKFARQSHNSRLKELADASNTNLYVSNLPRLINEEGLEAIFKSVYPDYHVGSRKILKDGNGISRGVGFARFETPEICQTIIDTFNNKTIGEGKNATTLQIRYADTEPQKQLKTYTAEKRQFKTQEYNEAVYGPGSPYRFYSPVSGTFPSPVEARPNGAWISQSTPASSISSNYVGYPNSVLSGRAGMNGLLPTATIKSEIDVAPARRTTHIKIESPSVIAAAKKATAETIGDESPDTASSSHSEEDTLVGKSKSSKAGSGEGVLSPTKSKL